MSLSKPGQQAACPEGTGKVQSGGSGAGGRDDRTSIQTGREAREVITSSPVLCGGGEGFTASTSDPDRQSSLEPSSLPLTAAGKPHLHPSIRGQEKECMGNMNVTEEKKGRKVEKEGK